MDLKNAMHVHNVILLNHKNNEVQLHETTWVHVLIIRLAQISKSFTEGIKKVILLEGKSTGLVSQIWSPSGRGRDRPSLIAVYNLELHRRNSDVLFHSKLTNDEFVNALTVINSYAFKVMHFLYI